MLLLGLYWTFGMSTVMVDPPLDPEVDDDVEELVWVLPLHGSVPISIETRSVRVLMLVLMSLKPYSIELFRDSMLSWTSRILLLLFLSTFFKFSWFIRRLPLIFEI